MDEQKPRRRKRDRDALKDGEREKARRKKLRRKEAKSSLDSSTSKSRRKESSNSEISLTPNAVKSLATGLSTLPDGSDNGKKSKDLVVRLRVDRASTSDIEEQAFVASLSDGKHWMQVLVLNPSGALTGYMVTTGQDWIVSVHGYVTTEGQSTKYQLVPLVCLTSISVLSTPSCSNYDLGKPFPTPPPQPSTRIQAGTIGSFMAQRTPFLTNEELTGSVDMLESLKSEAPTSSDISLAQHKENLGEVGRFFARNSAMITLQTSTSAPPSPGATPTKRPTEHAVQNYTNGIREFSTSQLDRQKASLGTNAGREAADRASLIKERHNTTLEIALQETSPLSTSLLCSWHAALLKDLHSDAGKIRDKTVRAGHTVFTPPDRIRTELDMLFAGMESLQKRLDMNNELHAVLFAAIAMYGVVDIHPFKDGNGRLSRIVANWALRRAGLPFAINLFATPVQRAEYVLALDKTRHFLSLTNTRGVVSRDEVLICIRHTGVFSPLIRLIMDRVARAVLECNRVLEEKSGLAAEAAEDRAARRARERAAEGTCIICFDEKPNIATLCCGKAVHVNCIAEWLSGRNSCPVCRSELPGISGRVVRAASRDFLAEEEDNNLRGSRGGLRNARDVIISLLSPFDNTTTTTTADDSSSTSDEDDDEDETTDQSQQEASNVNGEDTTTEDATSDSDNIDIQISRNMDDPNNQEIVDETTTSDSDDDDTNNSNSNTSNDSEGGDTTTSVEESTPQLEPLRYCDALYCRNRPAVDCANSLCGRCCVLGGQYHCPRHNS